MNSMSQSTAVLEKRLYTATATATSGRDGRATSDDGLLDVSLAPPRALGGSGKGTNPEQLFAAGYAACFGSAAAHIARARKIDAGPITVTAQVSLGPVGQIFGLAVVLEVSIPQLSPAEAEALVNQAHLVCPYSNATRGNIEVEVRLAGS